MHTPFAIVLTLLAPTLAAASVKAAPEPFACPSELPRTEQSLKDVPAQFEVITAVPHPTHVLTGFRVNLGHPSEASPAINDNEANTRDAKGGTTETLTWNVGPLQDAYAVCLYRTTTQALIRPLAGYKECKVISRAAPGMLLRLESATCK